MNLKDFLISYFASEQYTPMRTTELADQFGLNDVDRLDFYRIIDQMLVDEVIRMSKRGKIKAYAVPSRLRNKDKKITSDSKNSRPKESAMDFLDVPEEKKEQEKELLAQETLVSALPDEGTPVASVADSAEEEKAIDADESASTHGEESLPPSEEKKINQYEGNLQANARGFAFFISDDPEREDVFIPGDQMHGAVHGDRVRIRITEKADAKWNRNASGEVIKLLARSEDPLVGLYQEEFGEQYVLADRKQIFQRIVISNPKDLTVHHGDKVIVELTEEVTEDLPVAKLVEIIGPAEEQGVDITSVARQFDLPWEFSEETMAEAQALPQDVSKAELRDRKDLRKKMTVTIDGADAKDFDDAITVERRGRFINLYVHIADVSHYVLPGSALDKDAMLRGNSVYLLDRVIPMLPEALSNGICSLNPNTDRLTLTTQMTFDENGNLVDHQFYPSVIHSDYRLIYEDVSDFLEQGIGFEEDEALQDFLHLAERIYLFLAECRFERGALDFDFPETQIVLDAQGHAVDVLQRQRRVANRMIEEFMIQTNVIIGTAFYEKNLPFVYRIHEKPSSEDIERLNRMLAVFRYPALQEEPDPGRLRDILQQAQGKREEGVLNQLVLRSMTKAIYSPDPTMHYGLAEEHYSHFTSPIRRYADLVAHRLLKAFLEGSPEKGDDVRKQLYRICNHITETEQNAEDAERDVMSMKSAEFMQKHVGEEFDGVITSLTNFGIFVMLENTVEGLVHFRDMTDDYYSFDEEHLVVRGERTHREFHYGDVMHVLVTAAKPILREVDFHWVTPEDAHSDRPRVTKTGARAASCGRGSKTSSSFRKRAAEKPKNFKGAKTSSSNERRRSERRSNGVKRRNTGVGGKRRRKK